MNGPVKCLDDFRSSDSIGYHKPSFIEESKDVNDPDITDGINDTDVIETRNLHAQTINEAKLLRITNSELVIFE
ncbi:unnamed protein product [Pieris brassicae]|uniref:Uncharacterized protein n=1 Tax=Pieris brassicae TaxID=7116 RepID=A0A9P0TDJ0_PIEBR|nr:unnamed protein product [Pieris brassicae]